MKYKVGDEVFVKMKIECIDDKCDEKENIQVIFPNEEYIWISEDEIQCTAEATCDDIKEAYNKGLNDARELIQKIGNLTHDKIMDVYGYCSLRVIFEQNTMQEALAKLKAYEEAQSKVEVGDVVTTVNGECPYIVTNVQLPNTLHVINSRNGYAQQIKIDVCKKTGKHLNVQQFLEQIGE